MLTKLVVVTVSQYVLSNLYAVQLKLIMDTNHYLETGKNNLLHYHTQV